MAAIPRQAYEELISEVKFFNQRFLLISDPNAIKQVLLDKVANYPKAEMEKRILGAALGEGLLVSDGDKWRSHRRLMAPSFDHKSIISYTLGMVEAVNSWLHQWDERGPGAEVDISQEMTGLTLKIISRAMFSTDSDGISELMGDTLKRVGDQLEFGLADAVPVLRNWRLRRRFARIQRIFEKLDRAIHDLIEARAEAPARGTPPDLLDRLVAARDAETGVRLSDPEVRDEIVIIFVAGHETTAVAMSFVWYLLSQHPDAEAKLHAELDAVLGARTPAYEDLANLPYTKMVIEEAMRLYPPAPGLSNREPQGDDVIAGRTITKNVTINILPWVLHRHRKLWDDPERFDPERFSPERSIGRHRFAYLPFGGGPRICIGATLAMTEAQLILATMAQRFRLSLSPGQDITLQHRVTLRPKNGMKMILQPRADHARKPESLAAAQ